MRLACECPDRLGRRLSPWDGAALARQLIAEGMVTAIAGAPGRRLLAAHQRKPWRHHVWLSPKPPRDAACSATVSALSDLDTRPRHRDALVLAVDEKTSRQPRPRHTPTRPAQPQPLPNRYEHESRRAGALNLCAACDPRSGQGYGHCDARKRQRECIDFLDALDREIDKQISTIHLGCDHGSTHHGTEVRPWLAQPPRVVMPLTPVHGSWMKHVEQWFSILQRKRLRIADVESKDHRRAQVDQFLKEWNQHAHPCNWSTISVAKIMAEAPALAA